MKPLSSALALTIALVFGCAMPQIASVLTPPADAAPPQGLPQLIVPQPPVAFVSTMTCTLSIPNCISEFSVPVDKTWQIQYISFTCTSDTYRPQIADVQFTTNSVTADVHFDPSTPFIEVGPSNIITSFGYLNSLSIFADPGSIIVTNFEYLNATSNANSTCNITLGGVTPTTAGFPFPPVLR